MSDAVQIVLPGIERPQAARDVDVSLACVARRFIEHCRVGKRLSVHSLRAYESDLGDFMARLDSTVSARSVVRDTIRDYVRFLGDERHLKESTIRRRLAALKVFFRWLEREELVQLSVFHRLDLSIKLPRRLPRALEPNEMQRLLKTAERENASRRGRHDTRLMYCVLVVLFTTGIRVGELLAICVSDVSLRQRSIRIRGKGNRERMVYLPSRRAISVLADLIMRRKNIKTVIENLVVTEEGRSVGAQRVRRRLRALAVRAGIERRITPHMLRHTAATQLLEAGVDIRFVQRLLGHSSIATTQIYTQVSDVALREKVTRADTLNRLSRRCG